MAVVGARRQLRCRVDERGPAFSFGEVSQVEHQAGFDEVVGVLAGVQLSGAHRVATENTADDDRACGVAGTSDGAVDPLVAGGIESLGEFGNRGCLTARSPPMRDFDVGGANGRTRQKRGRQSGDHCKFIHTVVLPTFTWS